MCHFWVDYLKLTIAFCLHPLFVAGTQTFCLSLLEIDLAENIFTFTGDFSHK